MKDAKLIERVKRLLAMAADGSSPHEAAIAAKRARSLMDKHQLSVEDFAETDEFGMTNVSKARAFTPLWEQTLAVCVAKYNDCIVDFELFFGKRRLRFKGFESDVMVAEFMFYYLIENGKRCCKMHMGGGHYNASVGTAFKSAYASELVLKFNELMAAREAESTGAGKGLMVVKSQLVAEHFGAANYGKSSHRRRANAETFAANAAGAEAGRNTSIHTGVDGDSHTGIE